MLILGLCLTLALAVMAWVSVTAISLDRQAELEETVRLTLWRMDSAVAPLIASETARPYFAYSAFYPPWRAYTRMLAEVQHGEVVLPSPLLTQTSPSIRIHFQATADGQFTSPQIPTGNMRDRAEASSYISHERVEERRAVLAELVPHVNVKQLLSRLPIEEPEPVRPMRYNDFAQGLQGGQQEAQQLRANVEWNARRQTQRNYQERAQIDNTARNDIAQAQAKIVGVADTVREGPMKPVWQGDVLLLARRVSVNGTDYVQGCWLDWPVLKESLLSAAVELFPGADLLPVPAHPGSDPTRLLTALPARLDPGRTNADSPKQTSPLRLSLTIAWICVPLAAAAVIALMVGAVSLSERRGAFVSAVTHELRTPLTTFRMYAEMLAEGMVDDPEKRQHYLKTLCTEADRLSHLVENVLSYARLERGRKPGRLTPVTVGSIIERVTDRLRARAEQGGMSLAVEADEALRESRVHADPSAVEQVLFNLVDNACKYAGAAQNRQLHLRADGDTKTVTLTVEDHGPGISPEERRRLFRPFSKSAREAANSAPGVGLGLALSRRLARAMGGDLRLAPATGEGAAFRIYLTRA